MSFHRTETVSTGPTDRVLTVRAVCRCGWQGPEHKFYGPEHDVSQDAADDAYRHAVEWSGVPEWTI